MGQPLDFPPPPPSQSPGRPICRTCGDPLDELETPRCGACGTPFDPRDPDSYSRSVGKPRTWLLWVPGVLIALGIGLGLLALAYGWETFGWGLVLGTPVAIGLVLGVLVERRTVVLIALGVILLVALITTAVTMNIAGVFCGVILGVIIFVPLIVSAVIGGLIGVYLRRRLERRHPGLYAPVVAIVLTPISMMLAEARFPATFEPEVVETHRVVGKSAAEAWHDLLFFEEIALEPPLLTRIGLPRPLRTEGRIRGEGDLKRCIYDKGWLTKRVTAYRPGELLAFDVVEQRGVEERSVELLSGSFRFEPLGSDETRITLTTVYRPLLAARALWRPFEHQVNRSLHQHVLDGIERAGR